jgi:hypothetical protein
MKGVNQLFVRMIGGMRGLFFGDDQSGSAPRPLPVIIKMPLAGQEIFGVVGEMCREHDAVFDRDAADLEGGKQQSLTAAHGLDLPTSAVAFQEWRD